VTQEAGKTNQTTLERAKGEGVVTVGFANENPYAYATSDGKLTGVDAEIARAVFKNMGIEQVNPVLTEFGSLIPGLNAGRFDVVTAGMYITPDRAEQADFANPEYSIGEALAVKAGNPLDLHSYEDIAANPKATIAVMNGAIEIDYLKGVGVSDKQIKIVKDQPGALAALKASRVDAITMTGPSLEQVLSGDNDPNIERVQDFKNPVIDGKSIRGYGAATFRKDDDDFREAYNKELKKLMDSGKVLEVYKKFGFTESELPGDITAEEVLESQK